MGNHFQVRLPHVTADKFQRLASLLAEPADKPQQRLDRTLLPDPQQPLAVSANLVDQCQITVSDR